MAEQHRATAEQWALIEHFASSTNIEVYGGVEALEAAAKPNHSEIPDSSLVERVAAAISGDTDGLIDLKPEARAAIREVAAWLSEQERYVLDWVAVTLEEEARLAALGDQAG